jgi:hypothetical protein
MWCNITIDLFKGLKKIVSIGILVDSPTRRVGESFFNYEYLREYEAQIATARNVVWQTYAKPIYAKTPENPPRCHVPLRLEDFFLTSQFPDFLTQPVGGFIKTYYGDYY